MKAFNKSTILIVVGLMVAGIFSSCTKDDDVNGGEPRIKYIRVTNPVSADSLLVGAGQGSLIAIVGENLQNAVEIWFNDQRANLTPTYITGTTILVTVPNPIPLVISNKMRILFSNGRELVHDFEVQISEPAVNSMVSEYVNTGEIATIRGDYFYEPLTVTFAGGIEGEKVSVTDKILQIRVPPGVQPGPITVKTNFGETESNFWFRDNRNLIITNDPFSGWWGQNLVVPGTDPLAISGNFIRMKNNIGEWVWTEMIGGPPDALGAISKSIPDDAVLNPAKYDLKFEVNTIKPYNGNRIKIMLGQVTNPDPDWNAEPYYWEPPLDTKGQWQTVILSLDVVVAKYKNWTVRPQGYGVKIWFHGPLALDADIAFDNFRVVPKISK